MDNMSTDMHFRLLAQRNDVFVYICEDAPGHMPPIAQQMADLDKGIILCDVLHATMLRQRALPDSSLDIFTVDSLTLGRIQRGELDIAFQTSNDLLIEERREQMTERLKQMAADIDKQIYDDMQQRAKERDQYRPPKEEIRWNKQQDRYRQNHHSKFHRRK